jgi:Cu/Ag efflux protein CusF
MWKVALLLNLALLLGIGGGYLWWGRRAERLEGELARARDAQALSRSEQEWVVRGVVRAVLPDAGVIVISHEAIAGFMAPMTMGFRVASPQIYDGVQVGDAVRFKLRGVAPNGVVIALERIP